MQRLVISDSGSENPQLYQLYPNQPRSNKQGPRLDKGRVLIDTSPAVDLNLHSWLVRASQCIPGYPRAFCRYVPILFPQGTSKTQLSTLVPTFDV